MLVPEGQGSPLTPVQRRSGHGQTTFRLRGRPDRPGARSRAQSSLLAGLPRASPSPGEHPGCSPAAPHVRLHSSPAASRSAWSQGPRARTRSEVWEAVVHQAPDHSRGSASALGSVFPCPTCPRGPGSGHAGSEHPMELVLCREKLFTVLISPRVFFPLL